MLSGPFPAPRDGHHVVVFVVDVSTTEEFLEHIKLAVSAALEVLPPHALVGLISAADHVRLRLLIHLVYRSAMPLQVSECLVLLHSPGDSGFSCSHILDPAG